MSKRRIVTNGQNADADLRAIFILDNLAAGRTPEELIAHDSGLSLAIIEAIKKRVLEVTPQEKDKSTFRNCLRIRHLIVALQPHPIVNIICDAFEGVRLGNGPSLRQMDVMCNYGEDDSGRLLSHQEFKGLRNGDETYQWAAVKIVDLDAYAFFSYCNAEGFRFYVPTRMIYSLVESWWELFYDLNPQESFLGAREFHLSWYSLLDDRQRHVIARFLWHTLDGFQGFQDRTPRKVVENALEDFWMQYLENPPDPA